MSIPHEHWIPMRDGVRLHGVCFLPRGIGPWPVVVVRTPYGPLPETLGWEDQRLFDAGYAILHQNVRSRFRSEGEEEVFNVDGWGPLRDGYDTVEWVAQQPWCNGQVATWGASAPGITQYLLAGSAPPHLTCQHIGLATGNLYDHAVFQGGAYRHALVHGWLTQQGYNLERAYRRFAEHRVYDDFWRCTDLNCGAAHARAPALHWGGWYDCFIQGTLDGFSLLQNRGGSGAHGRQRLIVGPWPHGIANRHGVATFPHHALLPPHIDVLEWFDWRIRGKSNGAESAAPVQYFVMGDFSDSDAPGNVWREAENWPVPCTPVALFLEPGGQLALKPPVERAAFSFEYDPEHPVPTCGGANYLIEKGAYDQRPVEQRPDVLLFDSPPLARPLEITGRLKVRLQVSSSCVDTDFTAKLSDVYPDGTSVIIHDGIVRLQWRKGHGAPSLIRPGRAYAIDVDLWSTSLVLNTGHRLRLAVSSSNFPRFEANNNRGDPLNRGDAVCAVNTIYTGGDDPAHVLLPVVGDGPVFA